MFPLFWVIVFGWVVYVVARYVYRVTLHPLARFPGPKLAALTSWYEFYYDVINPGQFIWKIQRLHERYGPIVRITPHELHIKDSEFYDEIYAPATKKRDKYADWVVGAGAPGSTFSTVSHQHHHLRRSAINPFFSKRAVAAAEPLLWDKIETLCRRFEAACKPKEVLRFDAAFMALTMDIISHYAYGESYKYLEEDDFRLEWKETVIAGSASGAIIRQFPWAFPIMKLIPLAVMQKTAPMTSYLMAWQQMVRRQVELTLANNAKGKRAEGTIFQSVLDSDLPPAEKTADRLQDEGQIVVGAGSETTAQALTIIMFHLLQDKAKLKRLREELSTVPLQPGQDGPLLSHLENLPYLDAVINEALRHMHGVTIRLPRVAHEPIQYNEWQIPPETPISQCNYFVHTDPNIFPDPFEFNPDRWIEAKEKGIRLDRYMVAFTKGSRQCVAINLAQAEMRLTLASVVRRFDFELFETTAEDIKIARDYFVGVPEPGSKGVRAVVTKVL